MGGLQDQDRRAEKTKQAKSKLRMASDSVLRKWYYAKMFLRRLGEMESPWNAGEEARYYAEAMLNARKTKQPVR